MAGRCSECGAPIPNGGSCQDNFHALLLLESQIPGGPGALTHFYAVGCYGLQHSESMNFTAEALVGLRKAIAEALNGRATIEAIRHRARQGAEGAKRVTRRAGEEVLRWGLRVGQ